MRGDGAGQRATRPAHRSGKTRRIEADGLLIGAQQDVRRSTPRGVAALDQQCLRTSCQQFPSLSKHGALIRGRFGADKKRKFDEIGCDETAKRHQITFHGGDGVCFQKGPA